MASVRTSTVVAASLGTIATGCVAYAIYFDYKRRNDPTFRKALKRESRRQARAAKEEADGQKTKELQEIRQMVDQAIEEGFPKDGDEKEAFFMEEVGMGEKLCQQSGSAKEAALCFFKALNVYPQPKELMTIYDKTVPKPVLDILAEMVAYDGLNHGSSTPGSSSAGVE